MTEHIKCNRCGRKFNKDELEDYEGELLCQDCINEEEDFRGLEEGWI